jgi:hypothetical protein
MGATTPWRFRRTHRNAGWPGRSSTRPRCRSCVTPSGPRRIHPGTAMNRVHRSGGKPRLDVEDDVHGACRV